MQPRRGIDLSLRLLPLVAANSATPEGNQQLRRVIGLLAGFAVTAPARRFERERIARAQGDLSGSRQFLDPPVSALHAIAAALGSGMSYNNVFTYI